MNTPSANLKKILNSIDLVHPSIREKFLLLMLPDKVLNTKQYDKHLDVKHNALKELEVQTESEFLNFANILSKAKTNIFNDLKELKKIDLLSNEARKLQIVTEIENHISKDLFNQPINVYDSLDKLLDELIKLKHPEFNKASKIREILNIQKSYLDDNSIEIKIDLSLDTYTTICENEENKQLLLHNIKDELLAFEYALTEAFNNEILFILGFIDSEALKIYAPKLYQIFSKRTNLYLKMWKGLPGNVQSNILQFSPMQIEGLPISCDNLLYYRLRKLINYYLLFYDSIKFENSPPSPNLPTLGMHLKSIRSISIETDLLNLEGLTERRNINSLITKLGISNNELAKKLSIDSSRMSQLKSVYVTDQERSFSRNNGFSFEAFMLCKLLNCTLDFLQEKTTIPSYGKLQFLLDNDSSSLIVQENPEYSYHHVNATLLGDRIFSIFESIIEHDKKHNTILTKLPELADTLLVLLSIIKKNYKDIDISVLRAINTLLFSPPSKTINKST